MKILISLLYRDRIGDAQTLEEEAQTLEGAEIALEKIRTRFEELKAEGEVAEKIIQ